MGTRKGCQATMVRSMLLVLLSRYRWFASLPRTGESSEVRFAMDSGGPVYSCMTNCSPVRDQLKKENQILEDRIYYKTNTDLF